LQDGICFCFGARTAHPGLCTKDFASMEESFFYLFLFFDHFLHPLP
jgi:hypothetical protein